MRFIFYYISNEENTKFYSEKSGFIQDKTNASHYDNRKDAEAVMKTLNEPKLIIHTVVYDNSLGTEGEDEE